MPTNVHTISFRGTAGAGFVLLYVALVLLVIGFATPSWTTFGTARIGLWEVCQCEKLSVKNIKQDWFLAAQALMSIGVATLLIAFLLTAAYMFWHIVNKKSTIIALTCFCFASAVFQFIGLIVYGVESTKSEVQNSRYDNLVSLSWSFGISALACLLCFVAGVVSIYQLQSSDVQV
jgi:ABC-type transport system involved in cytochrome c biogenesis permease subunit